jgi:serine/threonine-protein kinase HipA
MPTGNCRCISTLGLLDDDFRLFDATWPDDGIATLVFNILISNSDDHLRNHGFLYQAGGWWLAPAYDLNPVPLDINPRILTTAINEDDGTASVETALETAAHYGLKPHQARNILREVGIAVPDWRKTASSIGLSKSEIDRMAPTFEHEDLTKAVAAW